MSCYIDFPLDQEIEEGVPSGTPFNFPPEGDYALFFFTNETFTQVLSALWNGAEITYPEMAFQVIWHFLQNVEDPVSLCARIIECITTDTDVQAALRNFIVTDPAINEHVTEKAQTQVLSLENRDKNLYNPEICNPDNLFHQASVLVQLLHDVTEDIFEALEVATNQLERADIVITAFPAAGFNDTAATAFKVGDQIAEEIQEDYMGAYDEAMYDTLRCKVFCASKDDCELSITKVIDIYKDLIETEFPTDPVELIVAISQFIVTGDFPTDVPVYIMHLLVLAGIQTGSDIFGIDFGRLVNRIYAAADDGDNDWEVLCEDCGGPPPPDEECYDFVASEAGWNPGNTLLAVYHPGEGYGVGGYGNIDVYRDNPPFDVQTIKVTTNAPYGSWIIYLDFFGTSVGFSLTVDGNEYTFDLVTPIMASEAVGIIAVGPLSGALRIESVCLIST